MPLRLIFMGTPEFSVPTLRALHDDGHRIVQAYTRVAKPGGRRGMKVQPTPVEMEARRLGIAVSTPLTLRTPEALDQFRSYGADAAVVVAYGMILPQPILDATKYGCYNLHASLLPRWRGAAPINRAIMEGDAQTGVMVMKMDADLDTGEIALEDSVSITDMTTSGDLTNHLAQIGANLMVKAMRTLERDDYLPLRRQVGAEVSYAKKIGNSEARIDWTLPASRVLRHIHGLSPTPGAWCEMPFGGQLARVKVLRCEMANGNGAPGQLLDDRLTVACGRGAVRLLDLQKAGGSPMRASAFLSGARLRPPAFLY